jgi:hypothetical protein
MNRIKSTAQYMCRWIFVECKYIKYRIRTDVLRRPDRFTELQCVSIRNEDVDENFQLKRVIEKRINSDEMARYNRSLEKQGMCLRYE